MSGCLYGQQETGTGNRNREQGNITRYANEPRDTTCSVDNQGFCLGLDGLLEAFLGSVRVIQGVRRLGTPAIRALMVGKPSCHDVDPAASATISHAYQAGLSR